MLRIVPSNVWVQDKNRDRHQVIPSQFPLRRDFDRRRTIAISGGETIEIPAIESPTSSAESYGLCPEKTAVRVTVEVFRSKYNRNPL